MDKGFTKEVMCLAQKVGDVRGAGEERGENVGREDIDTRMDISSYKGLVFSETNRLYTDKFFQRWHNLST